MRHAVTLCSLSCFALSVFLSPLTAHADSSPPTEFGTWQTHYSTARGVRVDAVVELRGRSGHYTSYDRHGNHAGSGVLSNIRPDILDGRAVLRGDWHWRAGGSGTFIWWTENDNQSFRGRWWGDNRDQGTWYGTAMSTPAGDNPQPPPATLPSRPVTRPQQPSRPVVSNPFPGRPQSTRPSFPRPTTTRPGGPTIIPSGRLGSGDRLRPSSTRPGFFEVVGPNGRVKGLTRPGGGRR